MNRNQANISNLLLWHPKMPFCKLHVKTWHSPYKEWQMPHMLAFLGHSPKGPTSPSQSRASKGTQLSPGFIYLIQFSGPNVRGCHGLALDFHDMRVVAGPPSSEQNNLRTALNSCLGKGLCSLTKGFQSSPQGGAIPHHYHCVRFACSLVGSFGCLLGGMRTGKGTSIPVGS